MGSAAHYINLPVALVLLGSVLAAAGGYWANVRQAQERTDSANARAQSEKALREKAEEIARLNQELASLVTGGTAYAKLDLLQSENRAANVVTMVVHHEGAYPLYDLSLRIVDLAEFRKLAAQKVIGFHQVFSHDKVFTVGNLNRHQFVILGRLQLPDGLDHMALNVFFAARNGGTSQMLRLRRVAGSWSVASKVTRDSPDGGSGPVLDEKADEEFPRQADGSINWDG